ncbi:hypothetical protein T02_4848 [Trichinella nativa]|uniref:Uncharacterized protein n=1 Tax=Trichinella nativa TaxID=6335 RepID=A0A0V1KQG0_9BILA|nr:hypothetical protein T06_11241 [Trichinella sp. T6]KRZ49536.1 hypothetical protein T02_4848 [Trichinella nativa]
MSGQRITQRGVEWGKWEQTKSDYPAVYVTENYYDKMMENPQLIRLHQLNEGNSKTVMAGTTKNNESEMQYTVAPTGARLIRTICDIESLL